MSYPSTLGGLVICYVEALPFLKYTLASDLFFGMVLFGGYALLLNLGRATQPRNAAAPEAV